MNELAHDTQPAGPRYVFVVGSPRSGTTWLQLLLAQHPRVATTQETHLFHNYLGPLVRAYEGGRDANQVRDVGIHNIVPEESLYSFVRRFAITALDGIAAGNPGAEVVLEKSPDHVRDHALIRRVLPEAWFVHVVRDPRDVAVSMRSAGRDWGRSWAPRRLHGAAATWADHISAGLELAAATDRYREVRYEALVDDGARELGGLVDWLGLAGGEGFARRALDTCSIDNLRAGSDAVRSPWSLRAEPGAFYRSGRSGGWRAELGRGDVATVEYLAGPLMERLGYARSLPGLRRRPASLALFNALASLRDGVVSRLHAI